MTGKKSRPTHIRTVWFRLSLPMIICVASFMLYPFVYSLVLSFYSHKGLASSFVGAGNYVKMFHDPTFVKALGNNLLFLAIQVPLMLVLALFLAYLLETKDLKWVGFYRTALFLPCVTSLVAYSLVFRTMFQFDGLVVYGYDHRQSVAGGCLSVVCCHSLSDFVAGVALWQPAAVIL